MGLTEHKLILVIERIRRACTILCYNTIDTYASLFLSFDFFLALVEDAELFCAAAEPLWLSAASAAALDLALLPATLPLLPPMLPLLLFELMLAFELLVPLSGADFRSEVTDADDDVVVVVASLVASSNGTIGGMKMFSVNDDSELFVRRPDIFALALFTLAAAADALDSWPAIGGGVYLPSV